MDERPNDTGVSQYHFNTSKLNDFLTKKAIQYGCQVVDDEITAINMPDGKNITSLKGEKSNYHYDFYIDSTGFKRLLIEKMGAKWQSYSKYLKMKEAIVFPTEEEDEIPVWTVARAMNLSLIHISEPTRPY